MMDTTELKEGMIIKNYKELCRTLKVEPKRGGKSRIIHHDDFNYYFEYHKEGHKYIIDVVYPEPLHKVNNRNIYTDMIKELLLYNLYEEYKKGNKILILSNSRMFELFYMVNSNYKYYNGNRSQLSQNTNIDINTINDFYLSTYGRLKNTLDSTLKSLKSKGMIVHEDVHYITIKINHSDKFEDNCFVNRQMSEHEVSMYNDFIGEYMKINDTNMNKIVLTHKWKEYNNYVIDRMQEYFQMDNINYIYKAHKIYFNKNIVDEYKLISSNKDNDYIDVIGKKLNNEIVERYKLSYDNRYVKYVDIYSKIDDNVLQNMRQYEVNDMIVRLDRDNSIKLIDYTIKR